MSVLALGLAGAMLILPGCGGADDDEPAVSGAPTATVGTTPDDVPSPTAALESGLLVDVGGYRLWIRCWGDGTPTVIFEAPGPAEDSSALGELPDEVSAFTRVCVTDRAGQGQSEDGGPHPTTAAGQAAELATLLDAAGVAGPYVPTGYSWGGTIAYLFAAAHPEQSAGVVLIDTPAAAALADIAAQQAVIDNVDFSRSADELDAAAALGDTPLLVITRGLSPGPGSGDFAGWQRQQAEWLARSTNSRQVIAEKSDHFSILENGLDAIVVEVRDLVTRIRQ